MINEKARIINFIGWSTIILGVIGSLVLGNALPIKDMVGVYSYRVEESYNWYIAVIGSISSIISGIVFIGFAEIINLLQMNVNNSKKMVLKEDALLIKDELPKL